jgi:hypothetical protein
LVLGAALVTERPQVLRGVETVETDRLGRPVGVV